MSMYLSQGTDYWAWSGPTIVVCFYQRPLVSTMKDGRPCRPRFQKPYANYLSSNFGMN